jgi:hypothetical protein
MNRIEAIPVTPKPKIQLLSTYRHHPSTTHKIALQYAQSTNKKSGWICEKFRQPLFAKNNEDSSR